MNNEPIQHRAEDEIAAGLSDDRDYGADLRAAKAAVRFSEERRKFVAQLTASSETTRWRLAHDWLMKHNKLARFERDEVMKEIAEIRQDHANLYAAGKHFRHGLKLPQMVYDTLMVVDPNVEQTWNSGTPEEKKKLLAKVMRTFPEYRVARVV